MYWSAQKPSENCRSLIGRSKKQNSPTRTLLHTPAQRGLGRSWAYNETDPSSCWRRFKYTTRSLQTLSIIVFIPAYSLSEDVLFFKTILEQILAFSESIWETPGTIKLHLFIYLFCMTHHCLDGYKNTVCWHCWMCKVRNAQGWCVLSSWSDLRTAALSKSWLEFSHTPKS